MAPARNAGARVAQGEWLLFIDADTYPPPELLSDMRTLVGCGATMRPVGGKLWMRLKSRRDSILLRLFGLAPGVFLLCHQQAFRAIGGLLAFEERCYSANRGLGLPSVGRASGAHVGANQARDPGRRCLVR